MMRSTSIPSSISDMSVAFVKRGLERVAFFTPHLLNPTSGNVLKFLSDFDLGRYRSLPKCGIRYMPV
jgi:hypothetical protein